MTKPFTAEELACSAAAETPPEPGMQRVWVRAERRNGLVACFLRFRIARTRLGFRALRWYYDAGDWSTERLTFVDVRLR